IQFQKTFRFFTPEPPGVPATILPPVGEFWESLPQPRASPRRSGIVIQLWNILTGQECSFDVTSGRSERSRHEACGRLKNVLLYSSRNGFLRLLKPPERIRRTSGRKVVT